MMSRILVAAVLLAHAGSADAQVAEAQRAFHDAGRRVDVLVGAGIGGFIGTTLRDLAAPGVLWSATGLYGNPESVQLDVTYTGSRQAMRDELAGSLVGHGVTGAFRINVYPESAIEPYFYVGAGWSRYSLEPRPTGSPIARSRDNVLDLPFGIGASYRNAGLLADLRLGMRALSAADLVPEMNPRSSADAATMHRFTIAARIGYSL